MGGVNKHIKPLFVIKMAFLFCPWRAASECETSSHLPGIISLAPLKPIWAYIVNTFDSGFVELLLTLLSHTISSAVLYCLKYWGLLRGLMLRERLIYLIEETSLAVVWCPAGGLSFSFSSDSEKDKCRVQFPPVLSLFSKASSVIPSSSWSSSACVMCSSHAHFQLLIWPGCLLGRVSSGRSLQVHEQVSSKCY